MLTIRDCGLMLEPQLGLSMEALVNAAKQAEDLGFGYLFRSDHLLPTNDNRGIDSPECWTSLGVIAASTRDVKFGPLVTPVGFRNPALLAKMACTLDSFSGGRLRLALGAGWYQPEYDSLGYPFPPFAVRRKQLEEALAVMLPMIRNGRVDFDGEYFSAHTDCLPRPSGPLHVIVGGSAKSIIRIAARQADEWDSLASSPESLVERKTMLDQEARGRKIWVSQMGPFLLGRNASEVEANAKIQMAKLGRPGTPEDVIKRTRARGALCGTPDEFADSLARLVDAGVQRFYFQTLVPENSSMTELLADTLKDRF